MAQDISVEGGKYTITFKDAVSENDDDITGDKANIMNMALARGCWFQWEYTVQIELHTGDVEDDLIELGEMQALYAEVSEWTPQMLESPAALSEQLSNLLRWGAGSGLTDQASHATLVDVPGVTFAMPPATELLVARSPDPTIPPQVYPTGDWTWEQTNSSSFAFLHPEFDPNTLYVTSDGVYFRGDPADGPPIRVEPDELVPVFIDPIVASDADIAKARRELEAAIESKTQRNQEKQAQLQDLTAALQRWFTFTTNVNERKKRDADTIAGNFH